MTRVKPPLRIRAMLMAMTCACAFPTANLRGQDRGSPPDSKKTQDETEAKDLRKKRMDDMRRRAESTVVSRLNGAKTRVDLVAEPALRFSDHFHGAVDATLWLYGTKGRPVAAQAVQLYRASYLHGYYYCLASLSDGLIEAQWPGRPGWSSTKPGVEMLALPEAPKPAPTEAARTRQMREPIRRFAATRRDMTEIYEENRVLSQPVRRYRDPDSGIQDGAVFVFISNGTAPDFLVLLEARGPDLDRAKWHYGPLRMTTGQLRLRLDGKEVWSVPWEFTPGRNVYPTYVHFPIHERFDE